jgi:hypothetical protein
VEHGKADGTSEIDAVDILEHSLGGSVGEVVVGTWPPAPSFVTTERPYPTVRIVTRGARRRNLVTVVVGSMGVCVLVLVAAALRPHANAPAAAVRVTAVSPARPVQASVEPIPWTPVTTVPSLPSSGTITTAAGAGPLVVDGARTAANVVVTCGRHELRVGRGVARAVVVPCGGSLTVARGGKITVHSASEPLPAPRAPRNQMAASGA